MARIPKKPLIITIGIALLLVALVILAIKTLSSPAEGVIKPITSNDDSSEIKTEEPGTYSGKYLSFSYPYNFEVIPSQKSGSFLEVVKLSSTDHTSKLISIGVLRENLTNDSGINHRQAHPETYKQKTKTPESVVFTSSENGSEQTGYIQHNDMVVSISITTPGERDLSEDYETIVNSLKWK